MSVRFHSSAVRLVADVGGTNTRVALFDPVRAEFRSVSVYRNSEHESLEDVFTHWLDALTEPAPDICCLAVAAPPSADQVVMCNIDWSFSCRELANRFGFQRVRRLNDFEANAYALPHLTHADRQQLYPAGSNPSGRLATIGPGTGLGGAFLDDCNGLPRSFPCEPGHMSLAPANELELDVFRLLLPRHSNIYAELLVSGPGLARLYGAVGAISGKRATDLAPAEITRLAVASEDSLCVLALETFCALLGSVCGDFLLANGSYGGLYLAGGIAPKLTTFIGKTAFHRRLTDKGAMGPILGGVPVYVITNDYPGLLGAAHAPLP